MGRVRSLNHPARNRTMFENRKGESRDHILRYYIPTVELCENCFQLKNLEVCFVTRPDPKNNIKSITHEWPEFDATRQKLFYAGGRPDSDPTNRNSFTARNRSDQKAFYERATRLDPTRPRVLRAKLDLKYNYLTVWPRINPTRIRAFTIRSNNSTRWWVSGPNRTKVRAKVQIWLDRPGPCGALIHIYLKVIAVRNSIPTKRYKCGGHFLCARERVNESMRMCACVSELGK